MKPTENNIAFTKLLNEIDEKGITRVLKEMESE